MRPPRTGRRRGAAATRSSGRRPARGRSVETRARRPRRDSRISALGHYRCAGARDGRIEPGTTSDAGDRPHGTMSRQDSSASLSVRRRGRPVKHGVEQSPERNEPGDTRRRRGHHGRRCRRGRLRHPDRQVGQAAIGERNDVHALIVGRQLALDLERLPVQRMPWVLHRDAEFVRITSWVSPAAAKATWRPPSASPRSRTGSASRTSCSTI
jgi:hypothetical protein